LFNEKTKLIVVHGGDSQQPSLISMSPGNKIINVVNAGSKQKTRVISDYLTKNGVNSIDTLCFTNASKNTCDGAWILFSRFKVRQVIFPDNFKQSGYAKRAMDSAVKSGAYINLILDEKDVGKKYTDVNFSCRQFNYNNFSFESAVPNSQIKSLVAKIIPGEKELCYSINNHQENKIKLINTNAISVLEVTGR